MAWRTVDLETWRAMLAEALAGLDGPAGPGIARFGHVPEEFEGSPAIHEGPLDVEGDFTPPSEVTLVLGDLSVDGRVSTQEVNGADGNATLVVIGSLACATLVNDWASLVLVSGDIVAREWAFAAREDSSMVAGGDFRTPIFIGYDIWVAVGGTARMEAGIGYAAPMGPDGVEDPGRAIRPAADEAATARRLGLGDDELEWQEELETRLYERGTILPAE